MIQFNLTPKNISFSVSKLWCCPFLLYGRINILIQITLSYEYFFADSMCGIFDCNTINRLCVTYLSFKRENIFSIFSKSESFSHLLVFVQEFTKKLVKSWDFTQNFDSSRGQFLRSSNSRRYLWISSNVKIRGLRAKLCVFLFWKELCRFKVKDSMLFVEQKYKL